MSKIHEINTHINNGLLNFEKGKLEAAEKDFRQALRLDPYNCDANHNLGVIAKNFRKYDIAKILFVRAVKAAPNIELYWCNLIECLILSGEVDNVTKVMNDAHRHGVTEEKLSNSSSTIRQFLLLQATKHGEHTDNSEAGENNKVQKSSITDEPPAKVINELKKLSRRNDNYLLSKRIKKYVNQYPRSCNLTKLSISLAKKENDLKSVETLALKLKQLNCEFVSTYEYLSLQHLEVTNDEQMARYYAEQALLFNLNSVTANYVMGALCQRKNQLTDANKYYEKAIKADPTHIASNVNSAVVLMTLKKSGQAVGLLRILRSRVPYNEQVEINFCAALINSERTSEAKEILGFNPWEKFRVDAHYLSAICDLKNANFFGAISSLKQVLSLDSKHRKALIELSFCYRSVFDEENALAFANEAMSLSNNDYNDLMKLGHIYATFNKDQLAEEVYKKCLSMNPKGTAALLVLAKDYPSVDPSRYLQLANELLEHKSFTPEEYCHLHFACAYIHEHANNVDQAFENFLQAGKLKRQLYGYDYSGDQYITNKILENSDLINEIDFPITATQGISVIPIFIVGMPRSGTTLLEKMLSSHPKIQSCGEVSYLTTEALPISIGIKEPSVERFQKIRRGYLEYIGKFTDGHLFAIDKLPSNFRQLGLINKLFPEAKIINIRRDPLAVIWSNFRQNFSDNNLLYSYDLKDCKSFYDDYVRLCRHWKQNIGPSYVEIDYEHLVENSQEVISNLLTFIGVEWDARCLNPQNNNRASITASKSQVKKGVYKGSSSKWRAYEKFIRRHLGDKAMREMQ